MAPKFRCGHICLIGGFVDHSCRTLAPGAHPCRACVRAGRHERRQRATHLSVHIFAHPDLSDHGRSRPGDPCLARVRDTVLHPPPTATMIRRTPVGTGVLAPDWHGTVCETGRPTRLPMTAGQEGYPYEGLRRRHHQKRGHRRAQRVRQDTAHRGHVVRCRRRQPVGTGGRRHHGHRLRRRSHRPQAFPVLEPGARRVAQNQDQPHRHPGHGQLPHRRARGAARGRGRRGGGGLGARRRSADREAVGGRGRRQPAANRRARPARSRTGQPGALARVAASRLRARDRADSAADRRGEKFQGRGGPGADARVHLCRQRQRHDDRRRHPGRHDRPPPRRRGRRWWRWWPRPTKR